MLRSAVYGFEVYLLSTRPWKHGAKLEPNKKPAKREGEAKDPEHQGCADRSDRSEDGGWSGEYASADDRANADRNVRNEKSNGKEFHLSIVQLKTPR